MLTTPIPTIKFPSIKEYETEENGEQLVSLSVMGLLCESQYYMQGVAGALKDCYARKSVAYMLLRAQDYLPEGMKFKIYDAYRPIKVQQRLWDYFRTKMIYENPGMNDDEVDKRTEFFVSKPSYDIKRPSLHNTGGSVDLTIVDANGKELDMGTKFDDFSDKTWTNHYEDSYIENETNEPVRDNRRILYNAMIQAGFTNLPSEWWHYDYGTKFWAYFTGGQSVLRRYFGTPSAKRFPSYIKGRTT